MLSVSIIIPAWNEAEHIADCLTCATRQTVAAAEVLVVDNNSTDNTCDIVQQFIDENPDAHVKLMHQSAEQGLIPTRNYGFNHASGDILGRVDADSMLRPDWVEAVSTLFTEDPQAMGASGPVAYYDMPARQFSLKGDAAIRKHIYKADHGQSLLFGSNMAVRATAWKRVANEVCPDKEDVLHEDIDLSLHLIGHHFKTVYCPRMVVGISARRMDTSFESFKAYMQRFKNTFDAHPEHSRSTRPEYLFTAMYPILHLWYPMYQKVLDSNDINPAARAWLKQQMELSEDDALDTWSEFTGDTEDTDPQEMMNRSLGLSMANWQLKRATARQEKAQVKLEKAQAKLEKAGAKLEKAGEKAQAKLEKMEAKAERKEAKAEAKVAKRLEKINKKSAE